jgi:hypothetical protein
VQDHAHRDDIERREGLTVEEVDVSNLQVQHSTTQHSTTTAYSLIAHPFAAGTLTRIKMCGMLVMLSSCSTSFWPTWTLTSPPNSPVTIHASRHGTINALGVMLCSGSPSLTLSLRRPAEPHTARLGPNVMHAGAQLCRHHYCCRGPATCAGVRCAPWLPKGLHPCAQL